MTIASQISIGGNIATAPPHLACLAAQSLALCQSEQAARGIRRRRPLTTLYDYDKDGGLIFPAGLVPRVQAGLERAGHPVSIRDATFWVPLHRSGALEGVRDSAAQAAMRQPRGQFLVGCNRQRQAIAAICRLFPEARIMVVTPNNGRRSEIAAYLRSTELHTRMGGTFPGCIVPATSDKYHANAFWDVAIFDGAQVAGAEVLEHGRRTWRQMRYCVREPGPLDALQQYQLEALCGRVIYHDGYDTPPQVEVLFVDLPCSEKPRRTLTAWERKRQAIWGNASRNKAVASVAKALADGDGEALERWGLPGRLAGARVVVHVEVAEHGRQLQRLLPDWGLASNTASMGGCVEVPLEYGHRFIVTESLVRNEGLDADTIVRAGGTSSPLQIAGFPPEGRTHVIDFNDEMDRRAAQETASRVRSCLEQGWMVTGWRQPASYWESTKQPATPQTTRKPRQGKSGQQTTNQRTGRKRSRTIQTK